MLNKVADFIAKYRLMSREGLHLVALSGGADSVAMLLILKELGYRPYQNTITIAQLRTIIQFIGTP